MILFNTNFVVRKLQVPAPNLIKPHQHCFSTYQTYTLYTSSQATHNEASIICKISRKASVEESDIT